MKEQYLYQPEQISVDEVINRDTRGLFKDTYLKLGEDLYYREKQVRADFVFWGEIASLGLVIGGERRKKERVLQIEIDDALVVEYSGGELSNFLIGMGGWIEKGREEKWSRLWQERLDDFYQVFESQEGKIFWRADLMRGQLQLERYARNREGELVFAPIEGIEMPDIFQKRAIGVRRRVEEDGEIIYYSGVEASFQYDTGNCYWSLDGLWKPEGAEKKEKKKLAKIGVLRKIDEQAVSERSGPKEVKEMLSKVVKKYEWEI